MHSYSWVSDINHMIRYATMAPSGHNSQPWFFTVEDNRVIISPDYARSLPVADRFNRELFISLGCAVENMCISASHLRYSTQVEIHGDKIKVTLSRTYVPLPDIPLYLVEKRQSNRRKYNQKRIPEEVLDNCIGQAFSCGDVGIHSYPNGTEEFRLAGEYIGLANEVQMRNSAFIKELKSWMRYNSRHSLFRKDGLSYDVFGAPDLPAFISRFMMGKVLSSGIQSKVEKRKINSSSHLILFTSRKEGIGEWINTGRCLQRFLLLTTAQGIAHAHMNQPCEETSLRKRLSTALASHQNPQILLRLGYAPATVFSKRRDTEEVIKTA